MHQQAVKNQENQSRSVANNLTHSRQLNAKAQQKEILAPAQLKENKTGMPDHLKTGIENLSGYSMDDVKVHYNSAQPAQLNAHAYAEGSNIHIAPGQERHLPHEAWHVAQQKQGRVRPTMQLRNIVNINDDVSLEKEADAMGLQAMRNSIPATPDSLLHPSAATQFSSVAQRTSKLSKTIVKQMFKEAAVELLMLDEPMLNILLSANRFLSEEEQDDNDWTDAFNAFISVYTGILRMGEQYLVVAEAFRITLFEHLQNAEKDGLFPAKPLREFALKIFQITSSQRARITELKEKQSIEKKGGKEHIIDEKKDVTDYKKWSIEDVNTLLKKSSILSPLTEKELIELTKWYENNLKTMNRTQSKELSECIKKVYDHRSEYLNKIKSTRPKIKKKRAPKNDKTLVSTFNDSDSDNNSIDFDPDNRLEKHQSSMSSITGRSHVYGIDDEKRFRHLVTGLPYADTYLGLFKDGTMVPRLINGKTNDQGHRKTMSEVDKKIDVSLKKRDILFEQLDNLNFDIGSNKFYDLALNNLLEKRDQTFTELQTLLRKAIRPHIEALLFGSSSGLAPTEEDIEATKEEGDARSEIRKKLMKEKVPSAAAEMFQSQVPKDLSSGEGSESHAEQSLINTQLWSGLVQQLIKAIQDKKESPEEISQNSFTTLQLVINRSTCIGCARELTVELIRFWSELAKLLKLDNWRRAKYVYEEYVRFQIDFPAIYEESSEKKSEHQNFSRIVMGLRDAGWQVRIITGIETGTDSDKTNTNAKKRVEKLNNIPMFFVADWNSETVRFPVPAMLSDHVESTRDILINGIHYWLTDDSKSYTRNNEEKEDNIDKEEINKFMLPRTGYAAPMGSEDSNDEMRLEFSSKLGKEFEKNWKEQLEYDEDLQQMLLEGHKIQNVSGQGMNCLIRSIFTAAGINFDEELVKIVRQHLVEQDVADNGNMLDLLGEEGVTLIGFMQLQGVLPVGTGLTVHFSGGLIEVVEGGNQIHIWYENAHFQAIVCN